MDTFLKVLAEHPDTFISRKVGKEKAKEVSVGAQEILNLGGVETARVNKPSSPLTRNCAKQETTTTQAQPPTSLQQL